MLLESALSKWAAVARKNIVNVSHVQKTRFCTPGFEEIYFSHFYLRVSTFLHNYVV